MNKVHSAASGSIPRQSDLSVIAELQALALAIRIGVGQVLNNHRQLEIRS